MIEHVNQFYEEILVEAQGRKEKIERDIKGNSYSYIYLIVVMYNSKMEIT